MSELSRSRSNEIPDQAGDAIDSSGVIMPPSIGKLPPGYCYGVTRFADVVLSEALPNRFADLVASLESFTVGLDEVRKGGGGRTPFVRRFDESLVTRVDGNGVALWGKQNITIERRIGFDGATKPVSRTRGHEIDIFGKGSATNPFPGVAVEMEWNNKDPFFHRDLINFQALHREGAIVAGVIITRGPKLQKVLSKVLDKYGSSSTHWDKLIKPVNLGGGGECPLLLIGIELDRIDDNGIFAKRMKYVDEALELKTTWRQKGFRSKSAAKAEIKRLHRAAKISRL